MDDDIVTLLRDWQAAYEGTTRTIYGDAADEIERLRAIARYAEHRDNCEQPYTASKRICSCGLSDLQEARRG